MSKKSNTDLESMSEVLERMPKPKKKKVYAPIDINLPALPFYQIERKKSDKPEVYKSEDGTIKLGFISGKPTIGMQKVITYLLSKAPRKKEGKIDTVKLREEGVEFTLAEICRYLGIRTETRNRRTIQRDLEKLGDITLHLHKRYIVVNGKNKACRKTIESVGLFKIDLYDHFRNDSSENEQLAMFHSKIMFHPLLLDNLENGLYRLVGVDEVKQIKSPVAVRIHGILSMHNQSKEWRIGIKRLAEIIPISTYSKRKTKQVIKQACKELIALNFIAEIRIYTNGDGDEIVTFVFHG